MNPTQYARRIVNGKPCNGCGARIEGEAIVKIECSGFRCRATGHYHPACITVPEHGRTG